MRTPNQEQKQAIESQGGMLLSAGAGAGKTFVLVEKIIFIIKESLLKDKHLELEQVEIVQFMRGLVVLTFTKKAAKEMKVRFLERLELEKVNGDYSFWTLIEKNSHYLYIGTIHGFCAKWLRQGHCSSFGIDFEIVHEKKISKKIEELVVQWYENNEGKISSNQDLLIYKDELTTALVRVFLDPSLRVEWKEGSYLKNEVSFKDFWQSFVVLSKLPLKEVSAFPLGEYEEHKDKKWFQFLEHTQQVLRKAQEFNVKEFSQLCEFFKNEKRIPTPRTQDDRLKRAFQDISSLKKLILKNEEDILAYYQSSHAEYKRWVEDLGELFHYIDLKYDEDQQFSFSDLEYYTYKTLNSLDQLPNHSHKIHTLIVDEFQDTSWIQYDILNLMVQKDVKKCIFIGDIKQAIYGFRGGELEVFLTAQGSGLTPYQLQNNYRSASSITGFNNVFFEKMLTEDWTGLEKGIPFMHQLTPKREEGKVVCLKTKINGAVDRKISTLNQIEARQIFESLVEDLRQVHENVTLCILYKNLSASLPLVRLLLSSKVSARVQTKFKIQEEPIVEIFRLLIELVILEQDEMILQYKKRVDEILQYFGGSSSSFEASYNTFKNQYKLFGVFYASLKFFWDMGISTSFHKENISYIHDTVNANSDAIDQIWLALSSANSDKVSLELSLEGTHKQDIVIMTAHSSKGLEFDKVYLGGIHTNGVSRKDLSYVGSYTGSVRWKSHGGAKQSYKSPQYILEELEKNMKELLESHRLFYVATTRAKSELCWVDLEDEKGPLAFGSESWISYLRAFEELIKDYVLFRTITINQNCEDLSMKRPFFHYDSSSTYTIPSSMELGYCPELSVTSLIGLYQCPRKFYLKNICKLSDEYFSRAPLPSATDKMTISSAHRGTFFHEVLYQALGNRFQIPLEKEKLLTPMDFEKLTWALEKVQERQVSDFIAEEPIKFNLFGQMISGTPDLVLVSPEEWEIIDYKTGKISEMKSNEYFVQLDLYAFAFFNQGKGAPNTITQSLYYIDQKEIVKRSVSKSEVHERVSLLWKRLANLDQINKKHCLKCPYDEVCRENV